MAKHVVGIDIGENSVKVAELEMVGGKIVLSSCDVVDLGSVPGEKSEHRQSTVIDVLRRIFEERGLKSKTSILAVSGQNVFIRTVKLPLVGRSKLNRIVRYEAQQQVPFPIEEIAWDYQVINNSTSSAAAEGGVRVRLVAIKNDLIDQIIRPALMTKLVPEVIDVGVLALYNCLDFIGMDLDECQAVLELGARTTTISVIAHNEVWSRSIPIAGNTFTRDIKNALEMDFATAERLKLDYGIINDPERVKELGLEKYDKAVTMTLNRLIAEITRSFGFYRTQVCPEDVKRIFLLGGSSEMNNIDEIIRDKFKIPVSKLNVLSRVKILPEFEKRFDVESIGHLLGTAVGLALRKHRRNPIEINLLPQKMLKDQLLFKNMIYYFISGLLVVISLLSLLVFGITLRNRLYAKIQDVQNEINTVRVYSSKLVNVQKKYKAIEQKFAQIEYLKDKRCFWLKLVNEMHATMPENIWLIGLSQDSDITMANEDESSATLRRSSLRRGVRRRQAAAEQQTKKIGDDIYIIGKTTGTYRDITEFAELLKKIPSFAPESIKILTAKPPIDKVREFTMQATLKKDK